MNIQKVKVHVTLTEREEVATLIARAEMEGIVSGHGAEFKLKRLEEAGITEETLAQYYRYCQAITCAFCQDAREIAGNNLKSMGFRFAEIKSLYLPTITATILSQVGDCELGNYMIMVDAMKDIVVDRDFVIKMSNALYDNSDILYAQKGQIGIASREINKDFMAIIVTSLSTESREAEIRVHTSQENPDAKFKALAMFAGLTLVNSAYDILYPKYDNIELARPTRSIAVQGVGQTSKESANNSPKE